MNECAEIVKQDVRDALIFCLWHCQGGSSQVGQTIRKWLGVGEFDELTIDQYNTARVVQSAFDAMETGKSLPFDYADAYVGAREDLAICKKQLHAAERTIPVNITAKEALESFREVNGLQGKIGAFTMYKDELAKFAQYWYRKP